MNDTPIDNCITEMRKFERYIFNRLKCPYAIITNYDKTAYDTMKNNEEYYTHEIKKINHDINKIINVKHLMNDDDKIIKYIRKIHIIVDKNCGHVKKILSDAQDKFNKTNKNVLDQFNLKNNPMTIIKKNPILCYVYNCMISYHNRQSHFDIYPNILICENYEGDKKLFKYIKKVIKIMHDKDKKIFNEFNIWIDTIYDPDDYFNRLIKSKKTIIASYTYLIKISKKVFSILNKSDTYMDLLKNYNELINSENKVSES